MTAIYMRNIFHAEYITPSHSASSNTLVSSVSRKHLILNIFYILCWQFFLCNILMYHGAKECLCPWLKCQPTVHSFLYCCYQCLIWYVYQLVFQILLVLCSYFFVIYSSSIIRSVCPYILFNIPHYISCVIYHALYFMRYISYSAFDFNGEYIPPSLYSAICVIL